MVYMYVYGPFAAVICMYICEFERIIHRVCLSVSLSRNCENAMIHEI